MKTPPKLDVDLLLDIAAAACEVRDLDWNSQDPTPAMDALDRAVDAWRKRLRQKGLEGMEP
jgi:hypothetical protein